MEHKEVISCLKDGKTGVCRDIKDKHAHKLIEDLTSIVNTLKAFIDSVSGVDAGHLATDVDITNVREEITNLTNSVLMKQTPKGNVAITEVVTMNRNSEGAIYQDLMTLSTGAGSNILTIMGRDKNGVSRVNTPLDSDSIASDTDIMNRKSVNSKIQYITEYLEGRFTVLTSGVNNTVNDAINNVNQTLNTYIGEKNTIINDKLNEITSTINNRFNIFQESIDYLDTVVQETRTTVLQLPNNILGKPYRGSQSDLDNNSQTKIRGIFVTLPNNPYEVYIDLLNGSDTVYIPYNDNGTIKFYMIRATLYDSKHADITVTRFPDGIGVLDASISGYNLY